VWRKSPEEEVGGGDVTQPEDGEGVLRRHGGVEKDLEDARVVGEVGDGE